MNVKQLPSFRYEVLAEKLKSITVSSYHSPKGISVIYTMPKKRFKT